MYVGRKRAAPPAALGAKDIVSRAPHIERIPAELFHSR
jgi:hypothetical protein